MQLIREVNACYDDSNSVQTCLAAVIKKLLALHEPGEVMSLLASSVTSSKCHATGHIVGQGAYMKYHDLEKAINTCTSICGEGCIHGASGEAFVEEAGLSPDVDPSHLNADELKKYGTRLCTRINSCHGVGHILFQIYNDFKTPLKLCSVMATGLRRQACYTGAMMENSDIYSTHNLLQGTAKKRIDDPKNPRSPCDTIDIDARHACLRYLPRMKIPRLQGEIVRDIHAADPVARICESFASIKDRTGCFEGIGFETYHLVEKDVDEARSFCEQFSLRTDRAGCMLGMIFWATSFDEQNLTLPYCEGVTSPYERTVCYHAIFNIKQTKKAEAPALCSGYDHCMAAFSEYEKDPWSTLTGLKL